MKYIYVSLLTLLFHVPALSQEKYAPGSVVTLQGDTVRGMVNIEPWSTNPKTFDFKSNDGAIKKYGPADVKSFTLSDKVYRCYLVSYDSTEDRIKSLSTNRMPSFKTAHLFLRVVLGGRKSLLEYTDSNERVHFFIEFDNKAEELIDHPFVFRQKGSDPIRASSRQYLTQLQKYFADCADLKISNDLPYSKKELKVVFTQYHRSLRQPCRDFDKILTPSVNDMAKTKYVGGYVSGLIVNLRGDTIKGQVNDELWIANPTQIDFKTADGKETKYRAPDIKAFIVADRMYRSYRVSYDSSSTDSDNLSTSSMPANKAAHLFLLVLIDSKKSFLQFKEKDLDDRVHYFIESDGNAEELVNHRFAVNYNGMHSDQFNKIYIQQLQRHFADCSQMKVRLDLPYSKEPLKKLFAEYSTCMGRTYLNFDHAIKPIINWGMKLGAAYEGYRNGFQSKLGEEIGLAFSITSPHLKFNTTYFVEFSYHKFATQTKTNAPGTLSIEANSYKLNLGMRYRLSKSERNKMFVTVGAAISFGLTDKYYDSNLLYNYDRSFAPIKGVFLGAGTWLSNFTAIDLRYELGNDPGGVLGGYSSVQLSFIVRLASTK